MLEQDLGASLAHTVGNLARHLSSQYAQPAGIIPLHIVQNDVRFSLARVRPPTPGATQEVQWKDGRYNNHSKK
jgi:hypothetical protein